MTDYVRSSSVIVRRLFCFIENALLSLLSGDVFLKSCQNANPSPQLMRGLEIILKTCATTVAMPVVDGAPVQHDDPLDMLARSLGSTLQRKVCVVVSCLAAIGFILSHSVFSCLFLSSRVVQLLLNI